MIFAVNRMVEGIRKHKIEVKSSWLSWIVTSSSDIYFVYGWILIPLVSVWKDRQYMYFLYT